jgi:WD40 repeat protein
MTVRLWDAQTGSVQSTLADHSGGVRAVAFSPNSQLIVSASDDSIVRLWDAQTGALRSMLKGHSERVNAISFSPNGQLVASASDDMTVRLWEAQTGSVQSTLEANSNTINAITISPDSQVIASMSYEMRRYMPDWDARRVRTIAISTDNRRFASATYGNMVQLWDTETGFVTQTYPAGRDVRWMFFSQGGSHLTISDGPGIDLEHLPDLEHPLLTPLPARSESSYRLEGDGSWISWNNHKVLWLPMEYRPSCSIFKDDILLIGINPGRVIFFRFDLSISPMSK